MCPSEVQRCTCRCPSAPAKPQPAPSTAVQRNRMWLGFPLSPPVRDSSNYGLGSSRENEEKLHRDLHHFYDRLGALPSANSSIILTRCVTAAIPARHRSLGLKRHAVAPLRGHSPLCVAAPPIGASQRLDAWLPNSPFHSGRCLAYPPPVQRSEGQLAAWGNVPARTWTAAAALLKVILVGRAKTRTTTPPEGQERNRSRSSYVNLGCWFTYLGKARRFMASIVVILIGALLFGLGSWILLLRFEGFVDFVWPRTISVGQMTIDGKESKAQAELLRARFDHHFRSPRAMSSHTGFLEVATLETQQLFQPKKEDGAADALRIDVSGVDVAKIAQFVNQLAKPPQWLLEGDFQTQSDRVLLALRLRHGPQVIRTWYLEQIKSRGTSGSDSNQQKAHDHADEAAMLLERLTDEAIFRLTYDFQNPTDDVSELRKWRNVITSPKGVRFPNPTAVAAYYGAVGALGRYYAQPDWRDLDVALEGLRTLRVQMPDFLDGLQLLGIVLSEKREEGEAIHVYEHLGSLLDKPSDDLAAADRKRLHLTIRLLKATAKAKLSTWQSAHDAVRELSSLAEELSSIVKSTADEKELFTYGELRAHCAVQLAHTYALYFDYLRHSTVTDVFKNFGIPDDLKLTDSDLKDLARDAPVEDTRRVVSRQIQKLAACHQKWLNEARVEGQRVDWNASDDRRRRRAELSSRIHLAAGYGAYRMAEWERCGADDSNRSVLNTTSEQLLLDARDALQQADAAHPNHYLVLQGLGLAYSEPRDGQVDLGVAEQYFERAIRANPFDYAGHELLSSLLLRRLANRGIDWGARDTINKGLAEAQKAIAQREISYTAHLRRAEFQTILLSLETDAAKRVELRGQLEQYCSQARRFLPRAFEQPDPDLTWVGILSDALRLGEDAEAIHSSKAGLPDLKSRQQHWQASLKELEDGIEALLRDCAWWKTHWIANQRVSHVIRLEDQVRALQKQIQKARLEDWDPIQVSFP